MAAFCTWLLNEYTYEMLKDGFGNLETMTKLDIIVKIPRKFGNSWETTLRLAPEGSIFFFFFFYFSVSVKLTVPYVRVLSVLRKVNSINLRPPEIDFNSGYETELFSKVLC